MDHEIRVDDVPTGRTLTPKERIKLSQRATAYLQAHGFYSDRSGEDALDRNRKKARPNRKESAKKRQLPNKKRRRQAKKRLMEALADKMLTQHRSGKKSSKPSLKSLNGEPRRPRGGTPK